MLNGKFSQKKILRAVRPKDCTLVNFILQRTSGISTYRCSISDQAGFLTFGSPYSPSLPVTAKRDSGIFGFRPRLQRRDRSRVTRDSLLNP